jgi:Cysteine rich repeat
MHCGRGLSALERVELITGRRDIMARFLFIIPLVLMTSLAAAQQQQGHDACARDVARHCRAVMSEGDQAVLACLKEHRARLSRPCEKVLTEHGQ